MSGAAPSLLSFVDAPVVVGDPEGRAAYVNPAFERCFHVAQAAATGEPLAALFQGGVREAVLGAVAEACEGHTVRFRLRQGGTGYTAVASPIVAEDARVGVVILLVETSTADERILALQRQMQEPMDELVRYFDELLEQTGGRRDRRYRELVEGGIRALSRVRKWNEELGGVLAGRPTQPARSSFDPVRVVREATARLVDEFEMAGVEVELLLPAELPAARGEAEMIEAALVELLRERLSCAQQSPSLTVAARLVGRDDSASVVISIVDAPALDGSMADPTDPEQAVVTQVIEAFGGDIRTTADPIAGRTTAIRLDVARS